MANLSIELPEDLARSLSAMAAQRHISLQQLAIDRLRLFAEAEAGARMGSCSALLNAAEKTPHLSSADVDELEAAIAEGRIPVRTRELL